MNDTARNLRYERVATFALWMSGFSPVALLFDSRSRAADTVVGFMRLFDIFQIHAPRQRGRAAACSFAPGKFSSFRSALAQHRATESQTFGNPMRQEEDAHTWRSALAFIG
jgi:hypothetical protein